MKGFLIVLILVTMLTGCANLDENNCALADIEISIGECQSDSTFLVYITSKKENSDIHSFEIFDDQNNQLGRLEMKQLPVTLEVPKIAERDSASFSICVIDQPNCCKDFKFQVPNCSHLACAIGELSVAPGDCTGENRYNLHLNFSYENAGNEFFNVFVRENKLIGTYKLADLPVTIENFESSGNDYDFIKVCINDKPDCCKVAEFKAPNCAADCAIGELSVDPGDCTGENRYNLHLNFSYKNAGNEFFNVFARENKLIGTYKLADLPVTIENFESSGNDYDFIKVCINDKPECCKVAEFKAPNCAADCAIGELSVDPGDCTGENRYNLHLNFSYENAGNEFFNVFARENKLIGTYKLADLPVTIENFESSGNDYDFIKVCINDKPDCCKVAEFKAPNCAADCAISELSVDRGECMNDSTYRITINFSYTNPNNDFFEVFGRENKFYGYFKLSDLPVTINEFRKSGRDFDLIKVCINDNENCCKSKEIESPNCSN